jgi:hypothetical protein
MLLLENAVGNLGCVPKYQVMRANVISSVVSGFVVALTLTAVTYRLGTLD